MNRRVLELLLLGQGLFEGVDGQGGWQGSCLHLVLLRRLKV